MVNSTAKQSSTTSSINSKLSINGRLDKLRMLMYDRVKQIHQKMGGSPSLTSEEERYVVNEINALIDKGNSAEAELKRIASQLKRNSTPASPKVETKELVSIPTITTESLPPSQHFENVDSDRSTLSSAMSTQRTSNSSVNLKNDIWGAIILKDVEAYNQQQKEILLKKKLNKREVKSDLDKQVQLNKTENMKKKQIEDEFVKRTFDDIEKWKEEEHQKEDERKKRSELQKTLVDQQVQEIQQRKQDEVKRQKEEEEKTFKKLKRELEKERKKEEKKKLEQVKEVQQFLIFNEEMKKIKQKEHEKEMEEEERLRKQAIEKAEKEERMRKQELQKILEKQNRRMESGAKLFKSAEEIAREDEERAKKQQEEIEKKVQEQARKKQEKLAKEKEAVAKTLEQQIEYKKKLVQSKMNEVKKDNEYLFSETKEVMKLEEEKKLKKKIQQQKNKLLLDEQVRIQHEAERFASMSEEEKKLNANLLKHIDFL